MKGTKKIIAFLMAVVMSILACEAPTKVAYANANEVLKGKDKWLFYKNESDGVNIPEYQGTVRFSKSTMKKIASNLKAMRKAVKKRNMRFAVMITPAKEIIYPEYMPDNIKRKTTVTRADQLVKYLRENTSLTVVYPKEDMMAAKENHQVFYKTDTHWNTKGKFVAVQELRYQLCDVEKTSIDDVKFRISKRHFAGDLATLLGQKSNYSVDTCYKLKTKVKKSEGTKENIFFFGDSFGSDISELVDMYWKKVSFSHIWQFHMSNISSNTDIVVWECAERYIDRLLWVKPYNK